LTHVTLLNICLSLSLITLFSPDLLTLVLLSFAAMSQFFQTPPPAPTFDNDDDYLIDDLSVFNPISFRFLTELIPIPISSV
jgi:hypothetical protein